jgi:hypothetical protein
MASGDNCRVKGDAGNALFLVYRDDSGDIVHTWAGIVGRDNIEPNTWYMLGADGTPYVTPEEG